MKIGTVMVEFHVMLLEPKNKVSVVVPVCTIRRTNENTVKTFDINAITNIGII